MYSTHNEGKSAIAKRFIKTLKNKIYKYITSVSKNIFIGKLDNIVNKYDDIYIYIYITYIDPGNETNYNKPKFKLEIMLDQNIKTFSQKVTLQIGLKKFL